MKIPDAFQVRLLEIFGGLEVAWFQLLEPPMGPSPRRSWGSGDVWRALKPLVAEQLLEPPRNP